jgi:hypothetical protein
VLPDETNLVYSTDGSVATSVGAPWVQRDAVSCSSERAPFAAAFAPYLEHNCVIEKEVQVVPFSRRRNETRVGYEGDTGL